MASVDTLISKDKALCTGCGACVQLCNYGALSMALDEEGFLYPVSDVERCTDCGACVHVCHMQKPIQNKQAPAKIYAACSTNYSELTQSSSGGIFFTLARYVTDHGGVVYGVVQPSLFDVHHARAQTIDQCLPMRRSKYLESHIRDAYVHARKDLKEGRIVLFTGTGCQVAGLYSFLNQKTYSNLITCEMVCHGVPSISVFQTYIQEVEAQTHRKVESIIYRDKSKGWNKNCLRLDFSDGSTQVGLSGKNPMHRGYLSGYYYRPSCGQCRYATLPRIADITLADFWQYEGALQINNQNQGISLVVCSSTVGVSSFDAIKPFLAWEKSDLKKAKKSCYHLANHPTESPRRTTFFDVLRQKGFHDAFTFCRQQDLHSGHTAKRLVKFIKGLVKHVIKSIGKQK